MIFYLWMMMQIICENLPISSSGHVTLLHSFFGQALQNISVCDAQAFDYFLQGASAILFFIYFFRSWWHLIIKQPISMQPLCDKKIWKQNIIPMCMFGLVVDGITALFWCLRIKDFVQLPLTAGFMITGAMLWSMHYAQEKKNIDLWSLRNGLILGCVQGFALLQGVSRFASTMAILQWLGYPRLTAFSISFLVQWPLIVAGSIKGILDLRGTNIVTNILTIPFLWAIVTSMIISYGVIVCVGKIIDKNCLWKFAYYMIIPVCISLFI